MIKKKAQAIVECFLNSSFSQELPIDIPIEMGEKLMERLMVKNPTIHPYVFREAQVSLYSPLHTIIVTMMIMMMMMMMMMMIDND